MIITQTNKQANKQITKKQTTETDCAKSKLIYIYSFNSRQRKQFHELCCCVCKNFENSEISAKYFFKYRYYGSISTLLFLHSL